MKEHDMTKTLITGASGQLGRLTIDALLARKGAGEIAVLVRSDAARDEFAARGLDVRQGDYSDAASLPDAMAGIDTVLLISSSEIGQRAAQHQNVITAAKAAGVRRIVYTSILRADESPLALAQEHKATEAALAESGLVTTVLRNGWYAENHTMGLGQALAMGQVFGAAGTCRFSTATRADYAEAAAVVLSTEGHDGKTYELGGDAAYTLAEYAEEVAKRSGKSVAYIDMPEAAFAEALTGAGLPEAFAGILSQSDASAAQGWLETGSDDLARLIGRPTTPIGTVIDTALAALAQEA